MEVFNNAKACRLKSCTGKYLTAQEDRKVILGPDGSASSACWELQFGTSKYYTRFRSCFGTYLTASLERELSVGRKVTQTSGNFSDYEILWQPIKTEDGSKVVFKAYAGDYLRADNSIHPWRNTVSASKPTNLHEEFQWVVELLEFGHVNLPKVSSTSSSTRYDFGEFQATGNGIEEIRAVAWAYYANCSSDYKAAVRKMFQDADTNGNGSLSYSEFIAACQKLKCPVNSDYMFHIIDKDKNGSVDFGEAVTFYYMLKNRRLFCDGGCKLHLSMSYFTCVECYRKNPSESFNICISCYGNKIFNHKHKEFLDNYSLLNHITPQNDPDKALGTVASLASTGVGIAQMGNVDFEDIFEIVAVGIGTLCSIM